MSNVGKRESATQQRVVQFFQVELGYRYRGNWQYRDGNATVDVSNLTNWLRSRGISETLIGRAIRQLDTAAALGEGKKLYQGQ